MFIVRIVIVEPVLLQFGLLYFTSHIVSPYVYPRYTDPLLAVMVPAKKPSGHHS